MKVRVLMIGMPFTYKLVDLEMLSKMDVEPVFSYQEGVETLASGMSVFYKTLTFEEIEPFIDAYKIKAIVCFNDNFLIEAAQLRTKYHLKGIQYPEILKFKAKSKMYKSLEQFIRVPQTIPVTDELQFDEIRALFGEGEYFIKPDYLAGSEGACHIKNELDYLHWKQNSFKPELNYIVQKFYPNQLVHCELIVQNNDIKYIQARQYSYPNHMFLKGKIIASFPVLDEKLKEQIEMDAAKVQKYLGYKNGVMHTEFFLDETQQLIFLETNIRQAGGAINLIHQRRAGISLETVMVLLELERDVFIPDNKTTDYDLCGYIPLKKGRVSNISIPELKGKYQFDVRVKIGENYNSPNSASNVAASFVGYSAHYSELIDNFLNLENNEMIEYQ